MTYPSGLTLDFQHDANGRVSSIASGGQTLVGNVACKPFGPAKSMDLGPLALSRTYDRRYQITGIQAGTVLNYGYTHDGAGNVKTISGIAKPELTPRQTDATHVGNRLISIDTLWAVPPDYPAASATYTHDDAGNITSDGVRFFEYNPNHRLARVRAYGATIAEYAYDGFERRTKKFADGVTTHYHYDLNGLLISETDGDGNPRRDYVYLNGEPVAMKVYGGLAGWYWFINDHLGTPQKMVDAAGTVVWAAAYAPFGEARVYSDEITNNLRFPGQYYDVETGLHYNWHRYYDPGTGRYLRADPIGLAGGLNLYAYVQNSPTNFFDRFGLKTAVVTTTDHYFLFPVDTHSAVFVENEQTSVVYDPGGGFRPNTSGSGRMFYGKSVFDEFINWHVKSGSKVTIQYFNTTPQDEEKILEKMMEQGGCGPFLCTTCSSSALSGVGPFLDLDVEFFPSSLKESLERIVK